MFQQPMPGMGRTGPLPLPLTPVPAPSAAHALSLRWLLAVLLLCLLAAAMRPAAAQEGDGTFLEQFQSGQHSFSQLLQRNLPYRVSYALDELSPDLLSFRFRFSQGSYIYLDSIRLIHDDDVSVIMHPLPEGREHEDAQGVMRIVDRDFEVRVQIVTSRAGQQLAISYQGCNDRGICYPAMQTAAALPGVSSRGLSLIPQPQATYGLLPDPGELTGLLSSNLMAALVFSLLMGTLLNLTPCVIVMLPIFSAMISGHHSRSTGYAVGVNCAYTLGLSLSYMLLGLLLSMLGAGLQTYLQHPAALFAMAAVLIACAVSAAGYFEFGGTSGLLSGVQAQMTRQAQGTLTSAFLFGVLSSIMTTPCTSAPLAGVVLYIMQDGNLLRGSLSFFAIGLGMSLPLCIIGVFGVRYLDGLKWQSLLFKKVVAAMLVCLAYYMVRDHLGSLRGMVFLALVFVISSMVLYEAFSLLSPDRGGSLITTLSCAIIATGAVYTIFEDSSGGSAGDSSAFQAVHSLDELSVYRGQDLYLIFTADWCTNCRAMHTEVYARPEFTEFAARHGLRLLECDITDTQNPRVQELLEHYQIIGVPSYVVLDRVGRLQSSGIGIKTFEEIRRRMEGGA